MHTHKQILVEKFVSESISLQVCVLYATQVFCHDKQFPKGKHTHITNIKFTAGQIDYLITQKVSRLKKGIHIQGSAQDS